MRFEPVQIVTAGSLGASLTSNGIDLNQIVLASIQAVWTGGTVDGAFTIEVSNDSVKIDPTVTNQAANVVNWTTYTGSSVTAAGAGDFAWLISDIGFRWVRLKFTRTSGTGTLNAIFAGKGV